MKGQIASLQVCKIFRNKCTRRSSQAVVFQTSYISCRRRRTSTFDTRAMPKLFWGLGTLKKILQWDQKAEESNEFISFLLMQWNDSFKTTTKNVCTREWNLNFFSICSILCVYFAINENNKLVLLIVTQRRVDLIGLQREKRGGRIWEKSG